MMHARNCLHVTQPYTRCQGQGRQIPIPKSQLPAPVTVMALDIFYRLPLELRLEILSYIPDLVTLYRITCASEALRVSFQSYPASIASTITARLPVELRGLLDKTLLILSSRIGKVKYADYVVDYDTSIAAPSRNHANFDAAFPSDVPFGTVLWLLLIACRIEMITQSLLSSHLDRINRIEIEHIADPAFRFSWEGFRQRFGGYPKGHPFTPETRASISYSELNRVVSSTWKLQLRSLRFPEAGSYKEATSAERDSKHDLDLDPGLDRFQWDEDQVECVQDHLNAANILLNDIDPGSLRKSLAMSGFYSSHPQELPLLSEPPIDEYSQAWGQDLNRTRMKTSAVNWFLIMSHPNRGYNTLMRNVDWEPFRRLGFGFWDNKRMCALGLQDNGDAIARPPDDQETWLQRRNRLKVGVGCKMTIGQTSFAWRSIRLDGERLSAHPDSS